MSKPHKLDLQAIIAGDVAPSIKDESPAPAPAAIVHVLASQDDRTTGRRPDTLKNRAHQLSVYLEPPVYEKMRQLAFDERTKLHSLMLEAVDLLLKKRGQPSIKKLTGGH